MTEIAIVASGRDAKFAEAIRAGLMGLRQHDAAVSDSIPPSVADSFVVLIWSAALKASYTVDIQDLIGLWSEGRLLVVRRDDTPLPLGMRDLATLSPDHSPADVCAVVSESREVGVLEISEHRSEMLSGSERMASVTAAKAPTVAAASELKQLGRYELLRVLGEGEMGVVYEGMDPKVHRKVAIKTILKGHLDDEAASKEYSMRFMREAQSVARLNHPNIVQVYDFGEQGDIAYIVMEFIKGKELKSFFDANERFELKEAVRIMCELLDALELAHEAGIVHRDIKPANVMLDSQARVKLADFGVARVTDDRSNAEKTQAGTMVGTPAYMSPEQITGGSIDRRSDVFSAGIILYQFLVGEKPFTGSGAWTIAKKIIQDHPPVPSSINNTISPLFDAVVNKALAKSVEQRYQSAREFGAALKRALEGKSEEDESDKTVVGSMADLGTIAKPSAQMAGAKVDATKGTTATGSQEVELEFWRAIKDGNDPDDFDLYVQQFPTGIYAALAKRKIAKLRGVAPEETGAKAKAVAEQEKKEADEAAKREAEVKQKLAEKKVKLEAQLAAKEAEYKKREAQADARHLAEAKARREVDDKRQVGAKNRAETVEKAHFEAIENAKKEAQAKLAKKEVVLFADVNGSTKLFEIAGEQVAKAAIDECVRIMRESIEKAKGRVIKTIGDEVMALFPTCDAAADAAIEMQSAINELNPVGNTKIGVRIGFSLGPIVVQSDSDIFGDAVNLASRLSHLAVKGQIITARDTVMLMSPMLKSATRKITNIQIKGKAAEVEVYELMWQQSEDATTMAASRSVYKPKNTTLRLVLQGQEHLLTDERTAVSMGRAAAADLVITDRMASRSHCKIERRLDKFVLTDHSASGTFVRVDGDREIVLRREEFTLRGKGWISFGQSKATATDILEFFCDSTARQVRQGKDRQLTDERTAVSKGRDATAGRVPADATILFVSYSHKDRTRIEPIVSLMEKMGRRLWMDRSDITGQAGWAGQIVRAIRECRAVVLMASPNSYASDQVVRELYLAMNHKKTIVPIEIEPADLPDELQYILAPFQHHKLGGGEVREVLGRALAAV